MTKPPPTNRSNNDEHFAGVPQLSDADSKLIGDERRGDPPAEVHRRIQKAIAAATKKFKKKKREFFGPKQLGGRIVGPLPTDRIGRDFLEKILIQ